MNNKNLTWSEDLIEDIVENIPVAVALWYIFKKDSAQPEPTKWLAKAFQFGVFSAFLSFAFSTPLDDIFGLELDAEVYPYIFDAFADAFLLAAIPEDLAIIHLFLFLYFFNKLRKRGKERIESLMNK